MYIIRLPALTTLPFRIFPLPRGGRWAGNASPNTVVCSARRTHIPAIIFSTSFAPPLPPSLAPRGQMDVNRIAGYLPGKIVFFLMQVGMPLLRGCVSCCA